MSDRIPPMRIALLPLAIALLAAVTDARADPCKAIPESGPMPEYLAYGATFVGRVIYVGEDGSLCVDLARRNPGLNPRSWAEVRIANFRTPGVREPGGRKAKAVLERVALGRHAICVAESRSDDRVVAQCKIRGRDLAELLRGAGVIEGEATIPGVAKTRPATGE